MHEFLGYAGANGELRFGSRPQAHVCGDRRILHRGYVANRTALAAEARRRGHGPRDISDAELFALAFDWWGADLARHVVGEYAVAVCDAPRRTLVLAHDELGLMPLFYAMQRGAISFATHLDSLVFETGVGDLDEEFIADHFARGEHFGDRTPYTHIRRLLPGETLIWQDGRGSHRDTWTLADVAPLVYRDEREYDAHLRHVVTEAVEAALPANRRVWCELSGGLDSSTVLSLACRAPGTSVEALSFVYPQSHTADERPWIEAVLREYPVPWHTIDADATRPFTEMQDAFLGEPTRWITNPGLNRRYLELVAAHDVEVVLTGEGGDSVLFGDLQQPYFLADFLLHGQLRRLWSETRRWTDAAHTKRSMTYWLLTHAVVPAVRQVRRRAVEYRRMRIPWAAEPFARRRRLADRGSAPWVPRSHAAGDSYMLQRVMRSSNVIQTLFAQRHVRTELRSPLLYRPLVEFMLAVPADRKLRPNVDRVLQRRAFAGIVPDTTLRRTNKGGGDQPSSAGLESSAVWVEALTARPRIVEYGYARLPEWREAVQRARVGRTVGLKVFEASATLEMWLQKRETLPAAGDAAVARSASAWYDRGVS